MLSIPTTSAINTAMLCLITTVSVVHWKLGFFKLMIKPVKAMNTP